MSGKTQIWNDVIVTLMRNHNKYKVKKKNDMVECVISQDLCFKYKRRKKICIQVWKIQFQIHNQGITKLMKRFCSFNKTINFLLENIKGFF